MKNITDMFNKYVQVYLDRSGFWNYRSQYFRNEDILKQQLMWLWNIQLILNLNSLFVSSRTYSNVHWI